MEVAYDDNRPRISKGFPSIAMIIPKAKLIMHTFPQFLTRIYVYNICIYNPVFFPYIYIFLIYKITSCGWYGRSSTLGFFPEGLGICGFCAVF